MTITKVSYGRTYSLGNYNSERIDLEASVTDSEHIEDVVKELKEMCDTYHKTNNPHLYQEQETIKETGDYALGLPNPTMQTEKISPEQEIEATLKGIEEATAETLPTFRIKAAQNIKTLGAYNRRKKQLNIS